MASHPVDRSGFVLRPQSPDFGGLLTDHAYGVFDEFLSFPEDTMPQGTIRGKSLSPLPIESVDARGWDQLDVYCKSPADYSQHQILHLPPPLGETRASPPPSPRLTHPDSPVPERSTRRTVGPKKKKATPYTRTAPPRELVDTPAAISARECRKRKKDRIASLEHKVVTQQATIETLQTENAQLRSTIAKYEAGTC